MKKIIILCLLIVMNDQATAAGEIPVAGTRASGMGGVAVVLQDLWSGGNNPAGLAFVKGLQAGLWVENRFLLQDLNAGGIVIVKNVRAGSFALHTSHFGLSDYGELTIGLSYGRLFGKSFAAGLRVGALNIHMPREYGSKVLPFCVIGFQFKANKRWILGIMIENPVPVKVSVETGEVLPLILKTGIGGFLNDHFRIMTEVEKAIDRPLILRAGFEYIIARKLAVRLGYASKPGIVTAGTSILMARWEVGISAGFHPVLGWTPGISVQWIVRSSKK